MIDICNKYLNIQIYVQEILRAGVTDIRKVVVDN